MGHKLLDTTVLIDLSRGYDDAAEYIETEWQQGVLLYLSVVSAMELVVGCRNKNEQQQLIKLIALFNVIQLSSAISAKAYELMLTYHKSHHLMIPDAFIAATVLIENMELVTDNVSDFRMISDMIVKRPY